MTDSTLSPRVMQKWFELDDALRADHMFAVAGLIAISKDSEVAVIFNPTLDKHQIADLRQVLKEQPDPRSPNASKG